MDLKNSKPHEIRVDFLGRVVILTPSRALRPHELGSSAAHPLPSSPPSSPPSSCFFCPGNEHMTPPEIARVQSDDKKSWLLRCFPNAFPALSKNFPKAFGIHEIIVETPVHNQRLSELGEGEIARYLLFLSSRLRAHLSFRKIKSIALFKNDGPAAGASIVHSHTQLIGLPFIPPNLKLLQKVCKSSCPFCLLDADEHYLKIISDGQFLAVAPWAPCFNHEVWIVPKAHIPSIADLDEHAIGLLAKMLRQILRAQDSILNFPSYNLIFHIAPLRHKNFHFFIQLCPRIGQWAGFEIGFRAFMNSIMPQDTALLYREWISLHP